MFNILPECSETWPISWIGRRPGVHLGAYGTAAGPIQCGIFPEKYTSDANHVAIAVVHGIGYLASWNFRHLVKVNTRREVNLVNALEGYNPIEIVAPPEL